MAWPQMPHGSATVAQSAWYKAFLRLSACAGLVDPGVWGLYPGVQMTLILVLYCKEMYLVASATGAAALHPG